jgi:TonB family protein
VIDPVTRELEARAAQRWPWRLALALSLGLHAAAGVGLLLAGATPRRTTTLPTVQVRLTALPVPAAAAAPPERAPARAAAPPAAPPPAAPPRPVSPTTAQTTPRRTAPPPDARPTVPPPAAPEAAAAGTADASAGDSREAPVGSPSGALTLGGGARGAGTDETFPYDYYLQRVLALIESNWFRPPAPEATRCRVRARIDRSGRLLEAGISQESGMPAFDRAALRAVFAAAPFPPLPQGFGGTTLTIHLEFGQ